MFCVFNIIFYFIISGAENPTYLKEPGDQVIVGVAFGTLAFGLTLFGSGLVNMIFGWGKVKK